LRFRTQAFVSLPFAPTFTIGWEELGLSGVKDWSPFKFLRRVFSSRLCYSSTQSVFPSFSLRIIS